MRPCSSRRRIVPSEPAHTRASRPRVGGGRTRPDEQSRSVGGHIEPWDIDSIPVDITDEQARRGWMRAMFVAGGLPYMWRERPMSDVIYGLLELRPGDCVLLIGEGVEPCGFGDGIRSRIGTEGSIDIFEITRDGRTAVQTRKMGRNGKIGCWQWTYTHGIAGDTYDAVAVLQSAQGIATIGVRPVPNSRVRRGPAGASSQLK